MDLDPAPRAARRANPCSGSDVVNGQPLASLGAAARCAWIASQLQADALLADSNAAAAK